MKKFIILTSLLFTFYYNAVAQNQPTLQTTSDWIFHKVKLYTKRIGPPYESYTIIDIVQDRNDSNEPVWSFTCESCSAVHWIYPLRITSYIIYTDGIQFNGTNVYVKFPRDSDGTMTGTEYRNDKIVIHIDMNMEENFTNRMTKALDTFILLKKKKASSNEAF